jgi:hypothetical protein
VKEDQNTTVAVQLRLRATCDPGVNTLHVMWESMDRNFNVADCATLTKTSLYKEEFMREIKSRYGDAAELAQKLIVDVNVEKILVSYHSLMVYVTDISMRMIFKEIRSILGNVTFE